MSRKTTASKTQRKSRKSAASPDVSKRLAQLQSQPLGWQILAFNVARIIRQNARKKRTTIERYVASVLPQFVDDENALVLQLRAVAILGAQDAGEILGVVDEAAAEDRRAMRPAQPGVH